MKKIHLAKRTVHVDDIVYHSIDKTVLTHFHLDQPTKHNSFSTHVFHIKGWIFPTSNIDHIRLSCGHHLFDRDLDLNFRPDVATHLQGDDENCGFEFFCNIYTILESYPLKVEAVFNNGDIEQLCTIKFSVTRKGNTKNKGIKPCLLMSMDRSGSTYLTNLLEKHQKIITYPQYPFEAWAVHYWMRTTLNMTAPLDTQTPGDSRSWSSKLDNFVSFHNRSVFGSYQQDRETLEWLYHIYPEQVARFSHESIVSLYNEIAQVKEGKQPRYFIEKVRPTIEALLYLNQRPDTRQIIVIRDVRDYTCSYLSFFGLEPYSSKQEMITEKICPTIWRLYECVKVFQDRSLIICYEELVKNPNTVLQKIFNYLEIKTSARQIQIMHDLIKSDKKDVEDMHVTAKSVNKSIGRWKKELSPDLINLLEDQVKEPMNFFHQLL